MVETEEETRVDWQQVLIDLSNRGLTIKDIVAGTDIPKSTLDNYKNRNAEPKHADGERLLMFWRAAMVPQVPKVFGTVRSRYKKHFRDSGR
jgi:hypothetical protein